MEARPGAATPTRRQLLRMIGLAGGSALMYQAMTRLGLAAESPFTGVPALGAAPPGASVIVLGAGLAGMVAAYELRQAGYRVQVLEYNARAGGRNWSIRGGDRFTELGGEVQHCRFDEGQYFNPGPWRIPHHHHGILHYCRRLGVALENFNQVNYNAWLHDERAFGGKPQRYRTVRADYHGHVAELLAKSARGGGLDQAVDAQDREILLESLRWWGALDGDFRFRPNRDSSERRGYAKDPGGGLSGRPVHSEPVGTSDVIRSGLWGLLPVGDLLEFQGTLLQPVGGMGRIGEAFARELAGSIRLRVRVAEVRQGDDGVRVVFEDLAEPGSRHEARADWCVCTLPLSILAQLPMDVGQPMANAIRALPYQPSGKVGLQFKRRFWEEDEHIYGGISYTSLPIMNIGYPNHGYHTGKGVLLGGYYWGRHALEFGSMAPAQRIRAAVGQGQRIHPQYAAEFENGVAVAWHRVPGAMGCYAAWTDALREQHYDNLCAMDGRIVLAGEHASYLPAWQEGAVTSALDAITRLHQRAVAQGATA